MNVLIKHTQRRPVKKQSKHTDAPKWESKAATVRHSEIQDMQYVVHVTELKVQLDTCLIPASTQKVPKEISC